MRHPVNHEIVKAHRLVGGEARTTFLAHSMNISSPVTFVYATE